MYNYLRAARKNRRRNGHDDSLASSSNHTRAQVRQALGSRIQAKLTVGAPNDSYEQEADRVANQVMHMPDGALNASQPGGQLQRQCDKCGEESGGSMIQTLQRQPAEEEEEQVQTKLKQGEIRRQADEEDNEEAVQAKSKTDSAHTSINTTTAENINSQRGKGVPLAQSERNFFEPRFGYDFSAVRIHTGAEAAHNAEAIQAKAFTLGRDLFFNSGEYAPGTNTGRRLMAHELTHVLQQGKGAGEHTSSIRRKVQVDPGLKLNTLGYTTTKSGDTYTCPRIVKKSIWNEIFTALLNSSRVFKLKGSSSKEADKSFREHMAARRNIVRFASKKKYAFNVNEKRNPTYWKRGGSTGWQLTTPPSGTSVKEWSKKAYADINLKPGKYEMACNQATRVTMEGGAGASFNQNTASSNSDWIPGDAGYVENTGCPSGGCLAGEEGENIIYTGKDKYWGHHPSKNYLTLQGWFNEVKSWNNAATINSYRLYPSNGIK